MGFRIHQRLTRHRHQEIKSFIEHSRQGMTAMSKQFSRKFDKMIGGWTEDAISDYIDHIYDDIAMLRDESPQLLRARAVHGCVRHVREQPWEPLPSGSA